jgi:dienelactone hydrolase
LAGWIDDPASAATPGGVVFCPGVGRDLIAGYPAIRRASERAAAAGLLSLRFDYPFTGDSFGGSGEGGDEVVTSWVASVVEAVATLRRAGCGRVGLVGLRLGALLAARAVMEGAEADSLVLWDPCATGREFIRAEKALYRLALDDGQPAETEIPGFVFSLKAMEDIRRMDFKMLPPDVLRMSHFFLRADRPHSALKRLAQRENARIEVLPPGIPLSEVFNGLAHHEIPGESETAAALANRFMDAPSRPWTFVPTGSVGLPSPTPSPGVVEKFVLLGPQRLFAVETRPREAITDKVVVLLNVADQVHIGPVRLWVDLARQFAAAGIRSVRVDLGGFGNSPTREPQDKTPGFSPELIQDTKDVVMEVGGGDAGQVVLLGLCSSGYLALEVSGSLPLAGVCGINPRLDLLDDNLADGAVRVVSSRRPGWLSRLHATKVGPILRDHLPELAWRVLDIARVVPSPATGLRRVHPDVVWIHVLLGDVDDFRLNVRGGWILRRLRREGRFEFSAIRGLDHNLFRLQGRSAMVETIVESVTRKAGAGQPSRARPLVSTADPSGLQDVAP